MTTAFKHPLLVWLVLALLLATSTTADASVAGASDAKAAGVIIAIVGVGALIGIGAYYIATHHGHSLKGCTSENSLLLNEGDQRTYSLSGNISAIRPGALIRVTGSKRKTPGASRLREFEVTRVVKDYGPCRLQR